MINPVISQLAPSGMYSCAVLNTNYRPYLDEYVHVYMIAFVRSGASEMRNLPFLPLAICGPVPLSLAVISVHIPYGVANHQIT